MYAVRLWVTPHCGDSLMVEDPGRGEPGSSFLRPDASAHGVATAYRCENAPRKRGG